MQRQSWWILSGSRPLISADWSKSRTRHWLPAAASASSVFWCAWSQAQTVPCLLGKCVQFSGAAKVAAGSVLPAADLFRVSMSERGELCYTAGALGSSAAIWVVHAPRAGIPIGPHTIAAGAVAWDIGQSSVVGQSAIQTACYWDVSSGVIPNPPVQFPMALPPLSQHPSAMTGVSDGAGAGRFSGWVSIECSGGTEEPKRAIDGVFLAPATFSSALLPHTTGQGCSQSDIQRFDAIARHVNLAGATVGFVDSAPIGSSCSRAPIAGSPFVLPYTDAVKWTSGSVSASAALLGRLQVRNGTIAERTSVLGVVAGWAGVTDFGACSTVQPGTKQVHAVVWNHPGLTSPIDLHALTVPFGGDSVAAAIESIRAPVGGHTVGGSVTSLGATLWRECEGWQLIEVSQRVLWAPEPDPSYAPGIVPPLAALASRVPDSQFEVVTDIVPTGQFAGFRDRRPFTVTRFEDLNSDLRVNAADAAVLSAALGLPPLSNAQTWDTRDLNQDGLIDQQDLQQLIAWAAGKALPMLDDPCACPSVTLEFRMSIEDAVRLMGYSDVPEFARWIQEVAPLDIEQADAMIDSIRALLREGGLE